MIEVNVNVNQMPTPEQPSEGEAKRSAVVAVMALVRALADYSDELMAYGDEEENLPSVECERGNLYDALVKNHVEFCAALPPTVVVMAGEFMGRVEAWRAAVAFREEETDCTKAEGQAIVDLGDHADHAAGAMMRWLRTGDPVPSPWRWKLPALAAPSRVAQALGYAAP
jgi:hypothetical protein